MKDYTDVLIEGLLKEDLDLDLGDFCRIAGHKVALPKFGQDAFIQVAKKEDIAPAYEQDGSIVEIYFNDWNGFGKLAADVAAGDVWLSLHVDLTELKYDGYWESSINRYNLDRVSITEGSYKFTLSAKDVWIDEPNIAEAFGITPEDWSYIKQQIIVDLEVRDAITGGVIVYEANKTPEGPDFFD